MKRAWTTVVLLICLLPLAAMAQKTTFDEGIDYKVIQPPVPTDAPAGQIEVLEMFWYGCPHCFSFEPHISEWKKNKPDDVYFRYFPGVLNPGWVLHARTFYAAEAMGVLDKLHGPLFQAMHVQGRRLFTEDAILRFVEQQGVDREKFREAMRSMEVQLKLTRATRVAELYQSSGVPSVIVNGRYLVAPGMSGDFDNMLRIIDHLVEKERRATAAR
ncbi:MAG: thiol:disulfide interchange protein DsbA/DsbL [Chromatiales bacterium]|nr:thiol:disulfide interchange protein DsbA/DsbL [Chromatiales bacterium]